MYTANEYFDIQKQAENFVFGMIETSLQAYVISKSMRHVIIARPPGILGSKNTFDCDDEISTCRRAVLCVPSLLAHNINLLARVLRHTATC